MASRLNRGRVVRLALSGAIISIGLLLQASGAPRRLPSPPSKLPPLILWAWERAEDLRHLDPGIGIAFHLQTIVVSDGALEVRRRRHPLLLSPGQALVAVTRIEIPPGSRPPADGAALNSLAALIVDGSRARSVDGIQLDFDATASQRPFYRQLIERTRRLLGDDTHYSVTALASWCAGDPWLSDLPIDEVIPMLFRMGPGSDAFREIGFSPPAAQPECRGAVGTSLDEPMPLRAGGRRMYVFNPAAWTSPTIAEAKRYARQ